MTNKTLFVVPLLAASAAAQYVSLQPLPARGMMPAFQAGMTFTHAPSRIVRKEPNLPVILGTFAPGGQDVPDYDLADVFAWIGMGELEVDAMSTGNDALPVVHDTALSAGFYRIQTGTSAGWATLYLSRVDPALPTGGADVFGYYFDNPAFPPGLTKSIYHEIVRADYQAGPFAPPAGSDVLAMDVNMGLIHSNQGFRETPILPEIRRLYFSLSHASAQLLEETGFVASSDPIDGAAIFVATYDEMTGQVDGVELHRTGAELGVPAGANVDALGVARVSMPAPAIGATHRAVALNEFLHVLSLDDNEGGGEELFVSAMVQNQPPPQLPIRVFAPLRTDDGLGLVGPSGRLKGFVKSVCIQDPDAPRGGHALGVPAGDTFVAPGSASVTPSTMNLSVTTKGTGPGAIASDTFQLYGVLSGGNQQGESLVGLWFTHLQQSFFLLLPNRPAGGQPYSFVMPITVPWNVTSTSVLGSINEYEVVLLTTPVAGAGFEVSTRSLLRRVCF